jgi:histidine ammonia-lyase
MIEFNGESLTIEQLVEIARNGAEVAPLGDRVWAHMQRSHDWVQEAIHGQGRVIYGVNTGFGSLSTVRIAPEEAQQLSRNLIVLSASGVGEPLPRDVVRAMMAIRANMLAKGRSGARPAVAQTLIDMLNAGVTPWVPSKGSLGASGDLAPLAHIAVVLTRDPGGGNDYSGYAYLGDELLSGAAAMDMAGIERLVLEAKEGLALSNGIDFMAAAGALAVHDAGSLLRHAEIAAAMSMEALLALSAAFDPDLHAASNQPGHQAVARHLLALVAGSQLIDSDPARVQDAYSLRCTPQVLGPIRDVVGFLRARFSAAINAVTDNPLILPGEHPNTAVARSETGHSRESETGHSKKETGHSKGTVGDGGSVGDRPQQKARSETGHSRIAGHSKIASHRAVSGGNFHGQGPAMWLDMLGIALAEVGSIAERRVFRLLTPELSNGLPSMLVPTSGLDGGLMMVQYTAAALVSDNKTLAHPDSVDSIPSCANQEDHVSMGANAARHAMEIVDNVRYIVAIELIAAAQGIDLRPDGPERLGCGTAAAYRLVRERVAYLEHDRETTHDMEGVVELVRSGAILEAVGSD